MMKLKNKYYGYFQYFCKEMNLSEQQLRESIEQMKPGDRLTYGKYTLLVESVKDFQNEKLHVLKLFDEKKKCIKNGPTIITKPKKMRRAVSPIFATVILIGISVAMAGVLVSSMNSSVDSASQSMSCQLINIKLYKITSTSQAYLIVKLQNTGNTVITGANITFIDDLDATYGFNESGLSIGSGDEIDREQTFAATIVEDGTYMIDANVAGENGSRTSCITTVTAR